MAAYLGIFSEVMATDAQVNLGGKNKRAALVEAFGERGFDYVGDHSKDLAIFSSARLSLLADPSGSLLKKVEHLDNLDRIFLHPRRWVKILPKALRVHQWAKNGLLIVPLITAHLIFNGPAWESLSVAFISFSLLASATYLLNDLHDLSVVPISRDNHRMVARSMATFDRIHHHPCQRITV